MSFSLRPPAAVRNPSSWPVGAPLTTNDVIDAYRLFLGRRPESEAATQEKLRLTAGALIEALLSSSEFDEQLLTPIRQRRALSGETFDLPVDADLMVWAGRFLPISTQGAKALGEADVWYAVFETLLSDPELGAKLAALKPSLGSPEILTDLAALREAETTRKILGGIDEILPDRIAGWALNATHPSERLAMRLLIDGRPAGVGMTGVFRRDLQAVHGGDGLYGFELRGFQPPDTDTPRPVTVEVIEAGSETMLGSGRLSWSRQSQAVEYAGLREDVREARATLERLSEALERSSRSFGYPLALYDDYRRTYYLRTPADVAEERRAVTAFAYRPRFTVLVPVDSDRPLEIEPLARSLSAQTYGDFTLTLVTDAQGSPFASALAQRTEAVLPGRVKAAPISDCADGADYAVLLAPGEILAADGLYALAQTMQSDEQRPLLLFGDEDHLEVTPEGRERYSRPLFRSAHDPGLLVQRHVLPGLLAVEADVLRRALAEGAGLGPDMRHALTLRLSEAIPQAAVHHVVRVLGHLPHDTPPAVVDMPAVRQQVDRQGGGDVLLHPDVADGTRPTALRIRWGLDQAARAAVIIPTRDRPDLLGPCLVSLMAFQDKNRIPLQIVVVDNAGRTEQTRAFLRALNVAGRTTQLSWDAPFNWAAINNFAAAKVQADVLIFLNDDTLVLTPDWSDELCRQALRPGVGAVGARLLYEDGAIQHAGIVFGGRGSPISHEGVGEPENEPGYLDRHILVRRVSAVTGACLASPSAAFHKVGGFDEAAFAVDANDVDYCLRLEQIGLATVYDPHCTLYHFESKSRGYTPTDPERAKRAGEAIERLRRRWGARLLQDPHYNLHFDRQSRPFSQLGAPPPLD